MFQEAITILLFTTAGKHGKEGAYSLAREQALVSGLLARLAHPPSSSSSSCSSPRRCYLCMPPWPCPPSAGLILP